MDKTFFENKENYNQVTLKQLIHVSNIVKNGDRNTALAEMFSVELKLTIGILKNWFEKNIKINFLELDNFEKEKFREQNCMNPNSKCSICDFPLQPRVKDGWCDHVIRSEYLFLENIYSKSEMKKMGIIDFEFYFKEVNQILDNVDEFCKSI